MSRLLKPKLSVVFHWSPSRDGVGKTAKELGGRDRCRRASSAVWTRPCADPCGASQNYWEMVKQHLAFRVLVEVLSS